jgi:DNA-binding transcriptional MerR regulator
MSRKLYTTVEVAKAAGVLRPTLQYWIKTGKISAPPVQLRHGVAMRLWTDAQMRRIRAMKGTFTSAPRQKARGARRSRAS